MTDGSKKRASKRRQNEENIRGCAARADRVKEELSKDPDKALGDLARAFGQLAFELQANRDDEKKIQLALGCMRAFIAERAVSHQRKHAELEREKWEFDISRACVNHFNELQKIIGLNDLDETERVERFRQRLFGEYNSNKIKILDDGKK